MGRCKNCVYYKPMTKSLASEYRLPNLNGGSCQYSSGFDMESDSSEFDILAEALDDSGMMTDLHVGPNFGCIQFIEKDKEG